MTSAQLCAALGIDRKTLDQWTRDGLPHTQAHGRREYDPPLVRQWLVANGLAQETRVAETLAEVAAYFGVHSRTAAGWIAAGAPGRPGHYDLHAIHAWRDAYNRRTRDPDPLLTGAASPALESYRRERAKIARLERRQKQGALIPRDTIHALLGEVAQILRTAGETLQRDYGQPARLILDEALDEAQARVDEALAPRPRPAPRATPGDSARATP